MSKDAPNDDNDVFWKKKNMILNVTKMLKLAYLRVIRMTCSNMFEKNTEIFEECGNFTVEWMAILLM